MTEITLKTDEEVGWPSINIGNDPLTGLAIYRRFKTLVSDAHERTHQITYEEWRVALDGKVYAELYNVKTYKVVDITDPVQSTRYTDWVNQLKPVLEPAINNTLQNSIPVISESGYVII